MGGAKVAKEVIVAHGHENIKATHRTTIEITKDEHLTPRGDCIIAVGANKGLKDFSPIFKELARNSHARITVTLRVNSMHEIITGKGHPLLTFEDPRSIVIRKSGYVCPRTLMVYADKAARDIRRDLIWKLRSKNTKILIIIEARLL